MKKMFIRLSRETKIGLLVGALFIVVIGFLNMEYTPLAAGESSSRTISPADRDGLFRPARSQEHPRDGDTVVSRAQIRSAGGRTQSPSVHRRRGLVCHRLNHWLFAGTGMKEGEGILGLVG